jgi:UDP-2,3-diacylglucosamine hydrolase
MPETAVLLLSDLHLPREPSPLRESFLRFLAGPARAAQAVYVLGDLFDVWIGDDAGLQDHAPEIAALRALSDSGVELYFMHGNRDFLIGAGFAAATGARLLDDPQRVTLDGVPTLLSHGDRFCTQDRGYQRWRRFSRHPAPRALYDAFPLPLRRAIASYARARSGRDQAGKPEAITDVSEAAIRAAFESEGVTRIIHGHTHRPAEHVYQERGQRRERIVLADWRPGRQEYLRCAGGELRRIELRSP